MRKIFALLLTLVLCISLCACGGSNSNSVDEMTVEDAYALLVQCATDGLYLEGWRVVQGVPAVVEYEDAQAYYDYCQAMRAYHAGGIGEAYSILLTIPDVLDAQDTLAILSERIGGLNGYYVADNGLGSYLHMVIRDGMVATKIIGYTDEEQNFSYTDDDFMSSLVASTYSDGSEFLAVGRYSSIGEKVTVQYVVNTYDDARELMVIKFEEYEYDTFNGLYYKVAELEGA